MNPEIKLPAVLYGGTGVESANMDMPDGLPERFEMGTLNISGVAGLNAALIWIKETGIEVIAKKENANREKLLRILSEYNWMKIAGESVCGDSFRGY